MRQHNFIEKKKYIYIGDNIIMHYWDINIIRRQYNYTAMEHKGN
jgi:hypothetical protein